MESFVCVFVTIERRHLIERQSTLIEKITTIFARYESRRGVSMRKSKLGGGGGDT
jgi:hypothetical protein